MMRRLAPALGLALAAWLALGGIARAVEPGEMLANPRLEARARTISEGLRCMVCQNESIDDSHAELAKDIRLLVRRRLAAGDSNQAIRDYLVARYGDFILLKPPFELGTVLLWGMPFIALTLGGLGIFAAARRRAAPGEDAMRPLDSVERRRLEQLLGDAPGGSDAGAPGHA